MAVLTEKRERLAALMSLRLAPQQFFATDKDISSLPEVVIDQLLVFYGDDAPILPKPDGAEATLKLPGFIW